VVSRGVVGSRVLAWRVVAAADVAAALAHAQMDPAHAERQALLAAGGVDRWIEVLDRIEMGAGLSRVVTLAGRICKGGSMGDVESGGEAITAEGIAALREEIEQLEGPARTEMAARIKTARELGDLKENAEYHIAKEDQAHLETKIKRLRERLRTAVVVEVDGGGETFAFGRTAEIVDESKGEVNTWTLVGSTEANLAEGRLSAESPIGKALRDAKVGEPIEIETPKGSRTFVVQKLVG
jgi:transcription elongation factor GreA